MKHSGVARGRGFFAILLLAPILAGCAARAVPDGWAAPVASGDIVVVHTESGALEAFRVQGSSATSVWRYPLSDTDPELKAVYATPLVMGDRVYVADYEGSVLALNVADGRPVADWVPPKADGRFVASPVVDPNGRMILVTDNGDVLTLDLATGALSTPVARLDGRVWSSPVLSGETLYVASVDRRVEAISIPDGAVRWEDTDSPVAGDLALGAGSLLVGGFDQRVRAFDLGASGDERWAFDSNTWFWARPLVADGTVYVVDVDGILFALDADTGAEQWRSSETFGEVRAEPALVGGLILVASREGTIAAYDASSGALRWGPVDPEQGQLLANPLVLDSGEVLYVSNEGSLLRVEPTSGNVTVLFERS
ncbi:MAG: PQQ-binding-like beta-propeller repeat protein [Dehalococcoidia bacterium]